MGVELKWNIDSESGRSRQKQDDPEERRASWRAYRRLLLGIIVLVGIVSLIVYLIARRSEQIDTALENTLRSVDATVSPRSEATDQVAASTS